jgi:hypothetical protein
MKWIAGIFLVVIMLVFNIPARADSGWKAAEHDYHVTSCSHARQRAGANDAPNCQSYKSGTAYDCCCGTCDSYFRECREQTLPQDMCERIKTNCQRDCNVFVSSSSASN